MGDLPRPEDVRAHGLGSPALHGIEQSVPQVVLLDCYANSNLFVGDETFRGLAGRLHQIGIEAALIDLVRDEAPPGKDAEGALSRLRSIPATVVVVSRAWSESLVAALRDAASRDARLVRYSHGAPSALDAQFDAVLDAEGIVKLLGGLDAAAPHWRRTRGELAVRGPTPAISTAARPSISGPAHGCPFLVDVRTSPAYRDSGIDYERVQTKGCAFCLDNVGAFAVFPAEEVVETWLTQLRALRRERPDVREILLTDERPHPYLPALFRAILDDSALHGIELLMKTRVDWLAEYADSAVRDACELAEQSGSVLHIYLVGFESFHQPDLDLFNKAVHVADNVRAIDTLRRLEAEHPRSFEFRRLHMHGIILFHPWTTPAALLDNARAMRAVRFHDLRLYALRTRMRLYASVPLHALAARQDLLVERFEDGRIDRAVEQGYDASVPWRFADPRSEVIFRAANRVADALPQLHDADVLEMVTRFVLRWPAFVDTPDLAALPLLLAPFSWGASPADVVAVGGAVLAGFDREVEAVAAGAKAACLKEAVPRADAEALVQAYAIMGLAAAVVSTHDRGGDDGRHELGDTHAIVAVARDPATLDRVMLHQRAVERGAVDDIAIMGELMGYPRCCVTAFSAQRARGDNLRLEHAPLRAHPDRSLSPLLNRLGAVALVSHMLCSPDCASSLARARAQLAVIADLDPTAPAPIATHLANAVLRLDYRQAAAVTGAWQGERYAVRTFRPFASADFGVDPNTVRGIRFARGAVVLELADGSERTHSAAASVLVEPNAPLADPVRRALEAAARAPSPTGRTQDRGELAAVDTIVALLSPQTVVDDHVIERTEINDNGSLRITLSHAGRRLQVLVRRWDPERPALSRRGAWSLDLDNGSEPNETNRKVIGALALLLPAGSHNRG
jgi:hypothetical protein